MAEENPSDKLRQKAESLVEERIARVLRSKSPADADTAALLHELSVHQIELELQNQELRRAQQELQASRNLYADLFEFAPVGYFTLGRYFLIEKANLTASRMLDRERRRLVGRRFMVYVVPADQDMLYGSFASDWAEGSRRCEVRMRRPDGTHFFAELKISKEVAEPNACKYRIAIVDVTERKRLEDELRASRDELEVRVSDRTKELSETVLRLNERSEQLQRLTAELTSAEERERKRIAHVLHDGLQQILVGAKYHLHTFSRDRDASDVSELIDEAIELSRSLTIELSPPVLVKGDLSSSLRWLAGWMREKYGLEVTLTICHELNPLAEATFLLVFSAARELLFNVAKHAAVKSARIRIDAGPEQLRMTVEDDGSGFDPNQRLAEDGQRSGIGLFGLRERLSNVGGRMDIDSTPRRGSRVTVTVPLARVAPEVRKASEREQSKVPGSVSHDFEATPGPNGRIRIVLVDDHLVVRQGLAGLLRGEPDLEVCGEASDGETAVKLVREIRPHVVLMDVSMSGMDGVQATSLIHNEFPEMRIIGLSMFQEDNHRNAMREAGAAAYLTKSGPSEELIETIRAVIR